MLKAFAVTDIGKMRKMNQDYIYVLETPLGNLPNILIVADGMGGHNAGDFASRLAVATVIESIGESKETDPADLILQAIEKANHAVFCSAQNSEELHGMGTTMVVATIIENTLLVVNVGDSRLYVQREHNLRQITKDHSWVEEMIRRGGMDRESAKHHPDKNIITRAIGVEDKVDGDFFEVSLKAGDEILMCTDGLTNMLDDTEISQILDSDKSAKIVADELVKAANEKGGKDNISVIVVKL